MKSSPSKSSLGAHVIYVLFVAIFILLALALVTSANGYLLNRNTFTLEETGIINLTVHPVPANISLNGKTKEYTKSDIGLSYLKPGRYSVVVSKPGYTSWSKNVNLMPLQVDLNPFVTLFLAHANPRTATEAERNLLTTQEANPLSFDDLDVRANEIWTKPIARTYPFAQTVNQFQLVARLSSPVEKITWFSARNRIHTHIVYQYGKEIHIMDRDGSNDLILATLNQDTPTTLAVDSENDVLIYRDGEQVLARALE
jgi:PEGA domain-containing protein